MNYYPGLNALRLYAALGIVAFHADEVIPNGLSALFLPGGDSVYLFFVLSGFLIGGLIALGLTLLSSRPWLAGLLIGLASVKPHFGVLIPLALVAGGYWRSFFSAALTVITRRSISSR